MKPNVLCVGFAKCGTTTLYDIMKQHPDIYLSGIKEPIYYGNKELMEKRGFEWYQSRYYPKSCDKKVIMEINPILGRSVSATQIKKDFGKKTKIIFLIREPASRIYSEFKMNLVDGTCFSVLKDNLGKSTRKLFDDWIRKSFYLNDNKYVLKDEYSTKYCQSGNYYSRIKDYLEVFGKENLQVLFFEDFIANPQKICSKIFEFIDIPFDNNINYNLHSNNGNRLPRSVFTIKANQIWFSKIYKQILIQKMPFISDNICKLFNYLTWQAPVILSRHNNNPEKMSMESREFINDYYYDMMLDLSELLRINLFEKWNIKTKQKVLRK